MIAVDQIIAFHPATPEAMALGGGIEREALSGKDLQPLTRSILALLRVRQAAPCDDAEADFRVSFVDMRLEVRRDEAIHCLDPLEDAERLRGDALP